jgi:hypothetical protein
MIHIDIDLDNDDILIGCLVMFACCIIVLFPVCVSPLFDPSYMHGIVRNILAKLPIWERKVGSKTISHMKWCWHFIQLFRKSDIFHLSHQSIGHRSIDTSVNCPRKSPFMSYTLIYVKGWSCGLTDYLFKGWWMWQSAFDKHCPYLDNQLAHTRISLCATYMSRVRSNK